MPGFSKDLNNRFSKQWETMRGEGLGNLANKRHSTVIQQPIKKSKKQNKGLSLEKIEKILNCCKSFIGCYASDQLENLSITFFPCTLIVNTDKLGMAGSHWICFRISKRKVELFDSLGLIYENKLPIEILRFIQRFAVSRTFKFNRRLQPDSSILCGFYCIFFIFLRQFCSFSNIQSMFSEPTKNDELIIKFFK